MPIDADQIKNNVDIVEIIGQFVELKREGSGFKGCCPFHDEKTGSFNVMPDRQRYFCHGCQEQGDVIDFISKHKSLDFKAACEFLGGDIKPDTPPAPRPKAKKKKAATPVPLKYEDAKNHYTKDIMQDRADFIFKNPRRLLKQAWPYKNEKGEVELVDVRFEAEDGSKKVLSMYWNGSTIKLAGYPILLFNRDLLAAHPEKPVLIVEGAKTAEAGSVLIDFVVVTWNGGGAKAKDVDLSPLKNREVFIFPDDDQKVYKENHPRAGQLLPDIEQPGNKTAAQIKKKLPHAKIVKPVIKAREVKKSGADLVEVLEVMSVDEVTAHILATEGDGKVELIKDKEKVELGAPPPSTGYPFTILGIADDGKAYYIGLNDRLFPLNLMSLNKTHLFNLAPINFWRDSCEATSGKGWESAISDLIHISGVTDFDSDCMRGKGAWCEPDGRICYHDGRTTTGEYDKDRIFVRRPVQKIGLNSKHATPDQRKRIAQAASELTFRSGADCVRILGWAVLAPFAGALPWRSACLLTAASGTGKTTIMNELVRKLSKSKVCSGGETTGAGVRQNTGIDSCSVIIDEAEGDSPKKMQNREDCFSLMRQSTSDDAPDVWKGTIDGKGMHFKLRSMFMFVSIDPTVNSEADENRIFRVNLKRPGYNRVVWLGKEKELKASLTLKICDGVRSFTWDNLKEIIELAEKITTQAQIIADIDSRTAFAESLLLAAYMAVFKDELTPSTEFINDFVGKIYGMDKPETRRNENEEMVDLLLDAIVKGDSGHNYTIREVLGAIETGLIYSEDVDTGSGHTENQEKPMERTYARRLAGMYGMGLSVEGYLAIAKNHPEIKKILNKGNGYQLQLKRHPMFIEDRNNNLGSSAGTKSCVLIKWDKGNENLE